MLVINVDTKAQIINPLYRLTSLSGLRKQFSVTDVTPLTKITATQNKVAPSYHIVPRLYFLAVVFTVTLTITT